MKIGHPEARCDCLIRWVFHGFPIRYPDSLNQTSLTQQVGLHWPYWQVLLQVLSQPPLMWAWVPGYTVYGKWDNFWGFIDSMQTWWTCDRGSKLIPAEVQAFPISLAVVPPFDVWGALFSWRQEGFCLAVHEKGAAKPRSGRMCGVEMPGNLRPRFILVDQFVWVWVLSILLYIGSFQVHFPCSTCQPSVSHPVARRANWRLLQWVALWSTAAWFAVKQTWQLGGQITGPGCWWCLRRVLAMCHMDLEEPQKVLLNILLNKSFIKIINPALQPNSIPESSTYVFQTLCQSPVFSVPWKLFRTYSQIQDLAILGYQW